MTTDDTPTANALPGGDGRERWRVGRSVGRTLYIGDRLIGMVDTPQLAEQIVMAVNRAPTIPADDLVAERFYSPNQLVNERPQGVKVTHTPTGLTASCDTERSALMNKVRCYEEIRAAIYAGVTDV